MVSINHPKTNTIPDWTQAQLDAQIALGNFAPGTTLADIVLPSDWNHDHSITGGTINNVLFVGDDGLGNPVLAEDDNFTYSSGVLRNVGNITSTDDRQAATLEYIEGLYAAPALALTDAGRNTIRVISPIASLTVDRYQELQDADGVIALLHNITVGISATITTAALTPLGAQGSMTFTNGVLTAETPAT